jgi:diguanylate cyclase (GGDEF)-like protein
MDLLFMDLDNMKWINDTLGHHEGDGALVDIATILKVTFRESDVVARMGGDEFAALVVDAAGEACGVVVKRLTENLVAFNRTRSRGYSLSVSVGTARYDPANPRTLDELLGHADTLMYEEKRRKQR